MSTIAQKYGIFYQAAFSEFKRDFENISEFVRSCPQGTIIEMGAGYGRIVEAIKERELILVESDPIMIALLNQTVGSHDNVKVIQADVARIPLSDESVAGAIFAANSIAEMKPLVFALAETARLLAEGGQLYLSVQNPTFTGKSVPSYRTVQYDDDEYTCHIETYPVPTLGKYSFQTHFLVRSGREEHTFVVSQTFPPIEYWKYILSMIGFDVVSITGDRNGGAFNDHNSFLINIVARKERYAGVVFQETLRGHYNKMAADYEAIITSTKYSVPKWVSAQAERWRGRHPKILDLACGNGWIADLLSREGVKPKLYGIDFSSGMLEQCRRSNLYEGLLQADLANGVPIAESMCFDVITAFGLMEFIPDPKIILSDIRRILMVGGEAWITFEATVESTYASGAIIESLGIRKYHYSKSDVLQLCEQSGLDVQEVFEANAYTSPSSKQRVQYIFVRALRGVS